MLNFCPLCVVEVYALRCDAMRAGTSHYPLHRPTTTYCFRARNRIAIRVVIPSTNSPMTLQRYAVFLYLQNRCSQTSKRCIKMGIQYLKSAILYSVNIVNSIHRDPHVAALLRMTTLSSRANLTLSFRASKASREIYIGHHFHQFLRWWKTRLSEGRSSLL